MIKYILLMLTLFIITSCNALLPDLSLNDNDNDNEKDTTSDSNSHTDSSDTDTRQQGSIGGKCAINEDCSNGHCVNNI